MTRNQIHSISLSAVVLIAALIAAGSLPVAAQDPGQPYPTMAPVEQYLMDRDAEVALARSAAPDAISHDASVIVLTRHGYETAVEGKNGWVCWVGRGWLGMFDNPEFWNPKVRAADCLNPPAARSILPYAYKRTDLLLAGHSKPRSHRRHQSSDRQKRITTPRAGNFLLHDVEGLVSNRQRRPQPSPPDVLRKRGRRCSLGRESRKLPSHGGKLLVHLRASLPTTQILPTIVGLSGRSREMVRRNAGTEHVRTRRQTLGPAAPRIKIWKAAALVRCPRNSQDSITNTR